MKSYGGAVLMPDSIKKGLKIPFFFNDRKGYQATFKN